MVVKKVCLACRNPKRERNYLCAVCWYALNPTTRAALWRRDDLASQRLLELYRAIQKGVDLYDIEVTPAKRG